MVREHEGRKSKHSAEALFAAISPRSNAFGQPGALLGPVVQPTGRPAVPEVLRPFSCLHWVRLIPVSPPIRGNWLLTRTTRFTSSGSRLRPPPAAIPSISLKTSPSNTEITLKGASTQIQG